MTLPQPALQKCRALSGGGHTETTARATVLLGAMSFSRSFGLGVAVGVTGAATFYLLQKARRVEQVVELPHNALRYGSPSPANLRFFDNFIVAFDTRTRNPQWVLEHITSDSSSGEGNRKNVEFREDRSFDERFRSRLSDYRGSGYDRGHLAPAANHKGSQKAMEDTFLLTNISPQVGKGFNRDYWARFERFVKQLAWASKEVFIITGPLYVPQRTPGGRFEMRHGMIGEPPALVSVPTHFFKVILSNREAAESGQPGEALIAAFVMPNAAIQPDLPLTAFAVPLEALECVSGLSFFPQLLSNEKRALHDRVALSFQSRGRVLALERAKQKQLMAGSGALSVPTGMDALSPPPLEAPITADAKIAAKELPIGVLDADQSKVMSRVNLPEEAALGDSTKPSAGLLHRDVATAAALREPHSAPPPQGPSPGPGADSSISGAVAAPQEQTAVVDDSVVEQHYLAAESRRLGMSHLCDRVVCQLPPPDWYLTRKEAAKQAEKLE